MVLHGFPVFMGINLRDWLDWIESFFVQENFTDIEKLNLAHSLIEGKALTWYYARQERLSYRSWTELKESLLLRFGTDDDPEKLQLKMEYEQLGLSLRAKHVISGEENQKRQYCDEPNVVEEKNKNHHMESDSQKDSSSSTAVKNTLLTVMKCDAENDQAVETMVKVISEEERRLLTDTQSTYWSDDMLTMDAYKVLDKMPMRRRQMTNKEKQTFFKSLSVNQKQRKYRKSWMFKFKNRPYTRDWTKKQLWFKELTSGVLPIQAQGFISPEQFYTNNIKGSIVEQLASSLVEITPLKSLSEILQGAYFSSKIMFCLEEMTAETMWEHQKVLMLEQRVILIPTLLTAKSQDALRKGMEISLVEESKQNTNDAKEKVHKFSLEPSLRNCWEYLDEREVLAPLLLEENHWQLTLIAVTSEMDCLIETAIERILIADSDGVVNGWRTKIIELNGFSIDDGIGKHLLPLLEDPSVEIVQRMLENALDKVQYGNDKTTAFFCVCDGSDSVDLTFVETATAEKLIKTWKFKFKSKAERSLSKMANFMAYRSHDLRVNLWFMIKLFSAFSTASWKWVKIFSSENRKHMLLLVKQANLERDFRGLLDGKELLVVGRQNQRSHDLFPPYLAIHDYILKLAQGGTMRWYWMEEHEWFSALQHMYKTDFVFGSLPRPPDGYWDLSFYHNAMVGWCML